MNRVGFEKPWFFVRIGIVDSDGDLLFKEVSRFGAAFPLERQLFLVLFEFAVDGRWANLQQQFPGLGRDAEWLFHVADLLPDEGGEGFPAAVPEENPDGSEGCDELLGVDRLSAPPFFRLPGEAFSLPALPARLAVEVFPNWPGCAGRIFCCSLWF